MLQIQAPEENVAADELYNFRLRADFGSRGIFLVNKIGYVIRERDGKIFRISQVEMNYLDKFIQNFRGIICLEKIWRKVNERQRNFLPHSRE